MPEQLSNRQIDWTMRVLLDGVCGANLSEVFKHTGIHRKALIRFMAGEGLTEDVRTRLGLFIFQRINKHLLITDDDRSIQPI
jgi:hypothetical protein